MYILFTDETNVQASEGLFFIYGGLFFHIDKLVELHKSIREIKEQAGYEPSDELKFNTWSRPDYVSPDLHTKAKADVIDICVELDCKFISYLILHDIISYKTQDTQLKWAVNHVIGLFNSYLKAVNDCGICVVDNLPLNAQYRFLSDKFCYGLDFEDGKTLNLDRIKLFAATSINASHVASAMDIVLGSFRYCINDPKNRKAASYMLKKIIKIMYIINEDTGKYFPDGMIIRPKKVKVAGYKQEYESLYSDLNHLLDLS